MAEFVQSISILVDPKLIFNPLNSKNQAVVRIEHVLVMVTSDRKEVLQEYWEEWNTSNVEDRFFIAFLEPFLFSLHDDPRWTEVMAHWIID